MLQEKGPSKVAVPHSRSLGGWTWSRERPERPTQESHAGDVGCSGVISPFPVLPLINRGRSSQAALYTVAERYRKDPKLPPVPTSVTGSSVCSPAQEAHRDSQEVSREVV